MSPELLAEGRARVTEGQITRVAQALWRHTDDELFGLGKHPLPRGSVRLLGYGLLGTRDLGAYLSRMQHLGRALPALPTIELAESGGYARVGVEPQFYWEPENPTDELYMALLRVVWLGLVHRLAAWAIGGGLPLVGVEVTHAEWIPDLHQQIFGVPATYEASKSAIVFDAARLKAPTMRTEEDLEAFLARSPAGLLSRPIRDPTVADQVRRMIEHAVAQRVSAHSLTSDMAAARLSISAPTLRRRLALQGRSFRSIRDDVLCDAAVAALVDGDESISEIGERLGFSEESAFARAFRRWTGNPPSVYRASACASDANI